MVNAVKQNKSAGMMWDLQNCQKGMQPSLAS